MIGAKFKSSWSKLGLRERILAVLTGIILAASLVDFIFFEPLLKSVAVLRIDLDKKKDALSSASKQRANMEAEIKALGGGGGGLGPVSDGVAKTGEKGRLWDGQLAAKWSGDTQRFFGEDLGLLSIASLGNIEAGYRKIYGHAVLLDGSADWTRLSAYVDSLRGTEVFRVEKLEVLPQSGRRVRIRLRMRIISGSMSWRDLGGSAGVKGVTP